RTTVIGYGTGDGAAWRIEDVALDATPSFSLKGGGVTRRIRLRQPGMHVIRNAAGVLALFGELGFDLDCVIGGLETFGGVRRRFEVKAMIRGISIIDDYAHHPTEVGSTIAAARTMTTGRLWVIFQPHRYTRTAALAPSFGTPLAEADRTIVTDVYSAGERPQPGITGRLVAEAVRASGGDVEYVQRFVDLPERLAGELEPGDTVVLMGAGDIATIWDEIADRIGERP
ncbi:MAG: cyanophycin synthetase, partial [Actinomycetota bacterium]|nr:cyanophycin synthetase [Actinomycetota bacterium]